MLDLEPIARGRRGGYLPAQLPCVAARKVVQLRRSLVIGAVLAVMPGIALGQTGWGRIFKNGPVAELPERIEAVNPGVSLVTVTVFTATTRFASSTTPTPRFVNEL